MNGYLRRQPLGTAPTFGDRLHESSNLCVFRAESRGPGADAWRRSWVSTAGRAGFEAEVRIRFVVGLGSPAIWLGRVPWLLQCWLLLDLVHWWSALGSGLRARLALELEKLADDWATGGDPTEARVYCREWVGQVVHGVSGMPACRGEGGLKERVGHLLDGPRMARSSPGRAVEAEPRLSADAFPG